MGAARAASKAARAVRQVLAGLSAPELAGLPRLRSRATAQAPGCSGRSNELQRMGSKMLGVLRAQGSQLGQSATIYPLARAQAEPRELSLQIRMLRPQTLGPQPVASTSRAQGPARCFLCPAVSLSRIPAAGTELSPCSRAQRQACPAKGFGSQVQEPSSRRQAPDQEVSRLRWCPAAMPRGICHPSRPLCWARPCRKP